MFKHFIRYLEIVIYFHLVKKKTIVFMTHTINHITYLWKEYHIEICA